MQQYVKPILQSSIRHSFIERKLWVVCVPYFGMSRRLSLSWWMKRSQSIHPRNIKPWKLHHHPTAPPLLEMQVGAACSITKHTADLDGVFSFTDVYVSKLHGRRLMFFDIYFTSESKNCLNLFTFQHSLNTKKMEEDFLTPRPTASPPLCPPMMKPREAKKRQPFPWLLEGSWLVWTSSIMTEHSSFPSKTEMTLMLCICDCVADGAGGRLCGQGWLWRRRPAENRKWWHLHADFLQ